MTNFTYNPDIPAAPNNPSSDQPQMLLNTIAVSDIWAIDHITFNTDNGGTHKQVTFSSKNTPAAQTDPQSVLYTANGTQSTKADLKFVNENGTFLINPIRAWGTFTCNSSSLLDVPLDMGFNVNATITKTASKVYVVAITPGAVTGTTVCVLAHVNQASNGLSYTYALNTLTIEVGSSTSAKLSFAILQN